MQVFPGGPSELFVALRDRPFIPSQSTLLPVADTLHTTVKRLHARKVTRERVRTVRSRRIPLFRVRECCVVTALALLVWPDVTQMQPPVQQSRAQQTDLAYRMSMANQSALPAPFRLDPATTSPD